MEIRRHKDFWAGLMFVATGLFFAFWGLTFYELGTAVRMGPAYFPAILGTLLAALGTVVLVRSLGTTGDSSSERVHIPFSIIDLIVAAALFGLGLWLARVTGLSSAYAIVGATAIVVLLTLWRRPDAKALVMITAATFAYGYLMQKLGLVLALAAFVFISASGGPEFRWKETAILAVVLIVFSFLVFVKGLKLPFPIFPEAIRSYVIR